MGNPRKLYKTNKVIEREGTWYMPDEESGCNYLLARAGGSNAKFEKFITDETEKLRGKFSRNKKISTSKQMEIMKDAFLRYCLLDWENVEDENGEPLEFTLENVSSLMEDCPDLYEELLLFASDASWYRDNIEEDLKN